MTVEIAKANTSQKDIGMIMNSKKFAKLNSRDIFERWNPTLKAELSTILLCGKYLELGHLINPRTKPSSEDLIFLNGKGKFDGQTYKKELMLYELV